MEVFFSISLRRFFVENLTNSAQKYVPCYAIKFIGAKYDYSFVFLYPSISIFNMDVLIYILLILFVIEDHTYRAQKYVPCHVAEYISAKGLFIYISLSKHFNEEFFSISLQICSCRK